MPINRTPGEIRTPAVLSAEGMLSLIKEFQLIPFFVNPIPGYSVEEHTPSEMWFTEDNLGPWDWKNTASSSSEERRPSLPWTSIGKS